jgi:hypothetical protein
LCGTIGGVAATTVYEHFPTSDEETDFALAVAKARVDRHADETDWASVPVFGLAPGCSNFYCDIRQGYKSLV